MINLKGVLEGVAVKIEYLSLMIGGLIFLSLIYGLYSGILSGTVVGIIFSGSLITVMKIPLEVAIPIGISVGVVMFVYQNRRYREKLDNSSLIEVSS